MKTYTFHVHGMHCASCVILIESELNDLSHVEKVKADLKRREVEVHGTFTQENEAAIAEHLSEFLKTHGYTLSVEKEIPNNAAQWADFKIAVPIALGFIALFIVLQKLGLVNLIQSGGNVTYGTAFVVGIVASVSTCMAVVGGLVLSMSANYAMSGDKVRPQVLFHAGRLVSFFIFGGLIGMIGSTVAIGATGTAILSALVAIILLILGINLLDVFHATKKLQVTMPSFISKHLLEVKKMNHALTPILVGAVTFFLPCGFTQSMQFYTLTTGNFLQGALTMSAFALGTLPMLSLLSFSSLSITKARSGIFFKTAGLVVIFFALLNMVSALTIANIIPPLFNL